MTLFWWLNYSNTALWTHQNVINHFQITKLNWLILSCKYIPIFIFSLNNITSIFTFVCLYLSQQSFRKMSMQIQIEHSRKVCVNINNFQNPQNFPFQNYLRNEDAILRTKQFAPFPETVKRCNYNAWLQVVEYLKHTTTTLLSTFDESYVDNITLQHIT